MIEKLISLLDYSSPQEEAFNSLAIENCVAETLYLLQRCAPASNLWFPPPETNSIHGKPTKLGFGASHQCPRRTSFGNAIHLRGRPLDTKDSWKRTAGEN
jgi:hypothetical protein